jgi:hypothetical protein
MLTLQLFYNPAPKLSTANVKFNDFLSNKISGLVFLTRTTSPGVNVKTCFHHH